MAEILHKIKIDSRQEEVWNALSTIDGLAGWWTTTTSGDSTLGETIEFRFGSHVTGMKVEAIEDGRRVEWRCVGSHPEWQGTRLCFELAEEKGGTIVRFGHREWREASDFFAHCSTKWATFMLSLKDFVETGEGRPFPGDLAI